MFCRNCGKEIPKDSVFCPECGFKLRDSDKVNGETDENKAKKTEATPENSVINLRAAMFTLAVISGIGALSVYIYGEPWTDYSYWFDYEGGSTIFLVLLGVCVITFVLGVFSRKNGSPDNVTDSQNDTRNIG